MRSIRGSESSPPALPKSMRQAVIVGPERFEVVSAAVPRRLGEADILVRTAACGICSGDLMPWYLQKKVGTVLGHEVVGWAVEVGREISNIRPGDLVFMHHHAPCHQCLFCDRYDYVHCPTWRASRLDPGGMAEWIRVPAINALKDTFEVNDLTVEQAVFIEPLACCCKAADLAYQYFMHRCLDEYYSKTVAVVGCGVMGLLNLAAAKAEGTFELDAARFAEEAPELLAAVRAREAPKLLAVEPDPDRRRLALRFGASASFTPEEAARELAGAVDAVIVGPGHPEVIRQALTYVRSGGVAVLFTPTPTGVRTELDLGDLYFREITLAPSYSCGPSDTWQAYHMLRKGKVPVDDLVTHRFGLEDVQKAYDTARHGGPVLKVLVTFAPERPS